MRYIQYTAQAITLFHYPQFQSSLSTDISDCFAYLYEGYGLNPVLEGAVMQINETPLLDRNCLLNQKHRDMLDISLNSKIG